MGRKIQDEFTNLDISKQQKYQLRKRKQGLCWLCGKPTATSWYCLKHAVLARERDRRRLGWKRRKQSVTYRLMNKLSRKAV